MTTRNTYALRHRAAMLLAALSIMAAGSAVHAQGRYTFEQGGLGPEWRYVGQADASKYSIVDGRLRLRGSIYELHEGKGGTFVGQELRADSFTVETKMTLIDTESGDEGGLCVYHSPRGYVQCCLSNYQGSRRLKVRLRLLSHELVLADQPAGMMREVWLRLTASGQKLTFYYSTDGVRYHSLEEVERQLLSPTLTGASGPGLVGMYAFMGSTKYQSGLTFADFDFFDYETYP